MGHDDKDQNNTNKYKVILLGLFVHFLLLFAVFDVYFSSPLDHGMNLVKATENPPAQRVVIFVADGLRAEAVLDPATKGRIPFLKSIMESQGSWGVAHTRVPTESRPGHVALLAGIYEDPSAIMKGWKANPVYFDSVINQSSNAWCWGSPDILNLFNTHNLPHIHLDTYSADLEDFGRRDTSVLDIWVFNKVQKFLEGVNKCTIDCEGFYARGNVFFLHLLGIDTAGHGYKPHSKEYVQNIHLVDSKVKEISNLFSQTFADGKTAFVFTADHGMTDWGSHGAGSSHETETPFITWGAGLKRNPARNDVKQIDIAPMLSALIGINIPSNSLGVIPLEYIDMPEEYLAEILWGNTQQLLEIFNVKRHRTESNALVFVPYQGLTSTVLSGKLDSLKKLREDKLYELFISECKVFMTTLKAGLDYYHNYYQYPLLISISLGFISWILFLVLATLNPTLIPRIQSSNVAVWLLNGIPLFLSYLQNFPFSYYIYFSFPFVGFTLLVDYKGVFYILAQLKTYITSNQKFSIVLYFIGIELLVWGFFNRLSFSLLSLLIGVWIWSQDSFGKYATRRDKTLWLVLCLILSIFPAFPVMKTTFNMPMYLLGCFTWILLFYEMFCRLKFQNQFNTISIQYRIFVIQFVCLVLAAVYSICIELSVISSESHLKSVSWVLSLVPVVLIPFTSTCVAARLIGTFFGFAPFYLLVSSNFEAFFSAIYVAILCNWLLIESNSFKANGASNLIYYVNFENYQSKHKITPDMFRRAFLFMVFIFIGFFGTGNIASLNSFDPMWVRAFLTVFSPFKMMGLILLKIMVPFLFTCCVFRAVNSIGKENIMQMFCIILIYSDLMVLQFLYLITNVGSWLDIGSSLSHFVIMEGFVTILLLLYGLAHLLTTASFIAAK